ncbi:MAG: TIM barrel protein [Methanomicrobiaceae archaeon]|nr:TIM barrel protein [Methanomicrobiaceae archaeon]
MAASGRIDHIQLLLIPGPEGLFRERLDAVASSGVPVIVHAPHHGQGVNPCDPGAALHGRDHAAAAAWTERAMNQTYETADRTGSPFIVLHPGTYRRGTREDAITRIRDFLDDNRDRRILLENLPEVYDGSLFIGTTAAELRRIGQGRVRGYCLDFAHLYCAANACGRSFLRELAAFDTLRVAFCHLSNTRSGSMRDEHLALDHPEGGLDFSAVMAFLRRRPRVQTSLEYKENDPAVYDRQLRVFDAIYRKFASPGAPRPPGRPQRAKVRRKRRC